MEKAILPGDRVWVWKIAFRTERDGIYLFNKSPRDTTVAEDLYLKRLIGLPGDTVLYQNDLIWINGQPHQTASQEIRRYNVGVNQMPLEGRFFKDLDIDNYHILRTDKPWLYEMDIPVEKIDLVRKHPYVTHLWRDDHNNLNPNYYKISRHFFHRDSSAYYIIPARNKEIALSASVWPVYESLLIHYEGIDSLRMVDFMKKIIEEKDTIYYAFKKDYLFFAGDNLPLSEDSRHWGLIPREDVYGKAAFVLYSQELYLPPFILKSERTFLGL